LAPAITDGGSKKRLRRAFERFAGSLAATLKAKPAALKRVFGEQSGICQLLDTIGQSFDHILSFALRDRPMLSTMTSLLDYLRFSMAHLQSEQVRVLFLNSGNRLLRDQVMNTGTVSEAPVYSREIAARALELGASGLILVHNHPSGSCKPSKADIQTTRKVATALHTLDIELHDHLIIASDGWSSFRQSGLLTLAAHFG
jgi:DNA repair protein RadC